MTAGLERTPVYPFAPEQTTNDQVRDSLAVLDLVLEHDEWISSQLGLESESPFRVDAVALQARREILNRNKSTSHCTSRGVHMLGILVAGTVKQMEAEFDHQTVLDIGCGDGRFGIELARNAKSQVTFFEREKTAIAKVTRKSGARVAGDGTALPFRDESFAKTMVAFSSIPWAETPLETVNSLNEALRVTEVDGTVFAIPFLSNILQRHGKARVESVDALLDPSFKPSEDPQAMKVWNLQDHLAIHTLLNLAEEGYCDITWRSFIGDGMNTGAKIENYSAIIYKHKPIPAELLADNVAYAESFSAPDFDK